MTNAKLPLSALLAQTPEGQQLMQLSILGTVLGVHDRWSDDQFVYMNGITNYNLLTTDVCKLIVSQGGEVERYPVFVSLTPTAYAKQVPEYMPHRTYTDENDVEQVYTWETYPVASKQEIEGKYYLACSSTADYWPASLWTQLDSLSGVNLVTVEEFKALQPTE